MDIIGPLADLGPWANLVYIGLFALAAVSAWYVLPNHEAADRDYAESRAEEREAELRRAAARQQGQWPVGVIILLCLGAAGCSGLVKSKADAAATEQAAKASVVDVAEWTSPGAKTPQGQRPPQDEAAFLQGKVFVHWSADTKVCSMQIQLGPQRGRVVVKSVNQAVCLGEVPNGQ